MKLSVITFLVTVIGNLCTGNTFLATVTSHSEQEFTANFKAPKKQNY